MSRLTGTGLISTMTTGLSNTYSVLANQFEDGLTKTNLASSTATTALTSNSIGTNFKSYLQTNFATIDTDKDGILSEAEINKISTNMSTQGMTRDQISQMGYSSDMTEKILSHFDDIDTNHDGKVTEAEISAYGVESEKQNKLTEYLNQKASNMSVFYGSEDSSSDNTYSLLSHKYLKEDE